ncbi:MAG: outer membrane beta-barrel protein [Bacteroidetes bacterium]|nr:outer membrane beta-barrel protein [Bacteroidota bacterium]
MRKLIFTSCLFVTFCNLFAQHATDCSNSLYSANRLYEGGQVREALNSLKPCIDNHNFSGDERFDAVRLMSLCYLFLGNKDSADLCVTEMLKIRHDYQQFHYVDPRELTLLVESHKVIRKLDIGIRSGTTLNQVHVMNSFATTQTNSTYYSRMGLNLGLLAEYYVKNKWSVLFMPNYNLRGYRHDLDNIAGQKKQYRELINTIELPVSARYYVQKGKWQHYIQAGIQFNKLVNSFADVQSIDLNDGKVIQNSTETTSYRNSRWFGYHAGIGSCLQIGGNKLTFGLNYFYFNNNVVIPEKRYSNVDFIIASQYVDSDFRISSLGFVFSYQAPIRFKVVKK